MSKILTEEEMMLVGGGCSRGLSRALDRYKENRNSAGAKAARRPERRCSQR
ncbi:conserved hypothetical protein [Vibrio chagasii]|uniref:hypothetical protein n=1 Tax=Vibrio chagasii TaxID=170679 RepID=UPI003380637F|nr:conserved hypothetical protein [Vibrio chagasii]